MPGNSRGMRPLFQLEALDDRFEIPAKNRKFVRFGREIQVGGGFSPITAISNDRIFLPLSVNSAMTSWPELRRLWFRDPRFDDESQVSSLDLIDERFGPGLARFPFGFFEGVFRRTATPSSASPVDPAGNSGFSGRLVAWWLRKKPTAGKRREKFLPSIVFGCPGSTCQTLVKSAVTPPATNRTRY